MSADRATGLSLWHETAGDDSTPRPALPGTGVVDVAVVGAGFTGLWTAYYLAGRTRRSGSRCSSRRWPGSARPDATAVGARALFPTSWNVLARKAPTARPRCALHAAMQDTVTRSAGSSRPRASTRSSKGGTITLARTPAQLAGRAPRCRRPARGFTRGRRADARRGRGRRMLAATASWAGRSPRTARASHPARLVRGLAAAVEAAACAIFEQTTVRSIEPGRVETDAGTVRAEVVLRATEGYTALAWRGIAASVAPVYSLMVATEPLPTRRWASIGLRPARDVLRRPAPDHLRPAHRRRPAAFRWSRGAVPLRLPHPPVVRRGAARVRGAARRAPRPAPAAGRRRRFTHHWGGASASPGTGAPRSGLDRQTGIGWAGGYVGDGVGTTNLAGRTLADLVLGPRPTWSRSPGWTTAAAAGSRNHCAGWASTPACVRRSRPTPRNGSPVGPACWPGSSSRWSADSVGSPV